MRSRSGGRWVSDHPEWLATYPDGEPTRHLSFAFPEVRDFYVRLLREWVEDYHADGVNILFSRSFPFVYYEKPVCEAFRKQYGADMRRFPAGDRRVQLVRASLLTGFLRQVRETLDQVGKAQGRRLSACYVVPVNNSRRNIPPGLDSSALAECLFNVLDVPTWIRENLVDYLDVHLHAYGEHDGGPVPEDRHQLLCCRRRRAGPLGHAKPLHSGK